jgi:hypothetical protein
MIADWLSCPCGIGGARFRTRRSGRRHQAGHPRTRRREPRRTAPTRARNGSHGSRDGPTPNRRGGFSPMMMVRSSGLEPPRAVKPTRPSTPSMSVIYVRGHPDRPLCAVSWTHRTHMDGRLLPNCCHALSRAQGTMTREGRLMAARLPRVEAQCLRAASGQRYTSVKHGAPRRSARSRASSARNSRLDLCGQLRCRHGHA